MPICEEIAAFIAGPAAGTIGTDVFAYKLPATPEKSVAVLAYFSNTSQRVLCPQPSFERLRFQIQVRGAGVAGGDQAAYARAYAIHRALDVVVERTIGGVRYIGIESVQPPFALHRDSEERIIFAANYEAWRVPHA